MFLPPRALLEGLLELSWAVLGASWAVLRPSGEPLEPSWAILSRFDNTLAVLEALLEAILAVWRPKKPPK